MADGRSLLRGEQLAIVSGAHDALSARLAEEAGFDGIWASSFGVSLASRCLPDTDLITMTEMLDATHNMAMAVQRPVIADCSAGYGTVLNIRRLVAEFEQAGAGGICIEDNPFPKRCSLYEGWPRELVEPEEMVGRIEAATSARSQEDFIVMARTEALIAGLGVEAALDRATAYQAAGADLLLIHAKAFEPLREFTTRWELDCPLAAVPTLYPEVSADVLAGSGFAVAIFPNQAVRASIFAMQQVLATLFRERRGDAVDDQIASLAEVSRIVDLESALEAELRFVVRHREDALLRAGGQ